LLFKDDLAQLGALVERVAHKHASLNVKPEHYPIVGKYLLEAIATILGDAVTPEIADAWTAAYAALADIFINAEKQLYAAHENWVGWRKFKIQRKVAESAEITSFYLVPEDGAPLPLFLPGQYIGLRVFIPEIQHMQPRQYSLSEAPRNGFYRISVKKEAGKQQGMPGRISNLLHEKYEEGDVVELTHPTGEFFVNPKRNDTRPIALISAGVGITPMMSILNSTVAAASQRQVAWIYGAHSSEVRAFSKHLKDTCEKNPNIKATIFTTAVKDGEVEGVDYHFAGRIDLEKVDRLFLDDTTADYYVCGPTAFMNDIRRYLVSKGVDNSRVHSEVFGVGDE
jgi:nitric oxide dioxygenase